MSLRTSQVKIANLVALLAVGFGHSFNSVIAMDSFSINVSESNDGNNMPYEDLNLEKEEDEDGHPDDDLGPLRLKDRDRPG